MSDTRDEIHQFVADYVGEHGYPPSYREIGDALGISSTNTIAKHMKKLEAEGRIQRGPKGTARSVRVTP